MAYKIDTGFDPNYFDITVDGEKELRDVVILAEYEADDPFVYLREDKHEGFILCHCEGEGFCIEQKLGGGEHYRLRHRLGRAETQTALIEYFHGKRLSPEDSSWENVTDEIAELEQQAKKDSEELSCGCLFVLVLWGAAAIGFIVYVVRMAIRESWI